MTKYIKQEVPDMQKTGEQKVFYRLKVERNIDFQEFIQKLCTYHSGISHGEALNNGIARRSWARNEGAMNAIRREMERTPGLKVTLPNIADEELIRNILA